MRMVLGLTLILTPLAAIFAAYAYEKGFWPTAIAFLIAIGFVAMVCVGAYLLSDTGRH